MSRLGLFSILLLLPCILGFTLMNREDEPLKDLLAKLEKYKGANLQEKVHIHTDKPYYSIGDSIWFKAYIVNASENRLSAFSKILYVDLINERDSIKKSLRLPIVSGLAWGDFVLSDSLTEGNYRIRAYTTWMRNFGEEFFFDKTIQIGNSLTNQIVSDVSYHFSKTGIKQNVAASITYQDISGKPLANKEVNYLVQMDFRNIASGKVVTDAKGHVELKFSNAQPFVLKSGRINTSIKLNEKSSVKKAFPLKTTSAEVDVQFFPESGKLVNGLTSKVGFKAVGADGLSREISGYISDRNNVRVAEFASEHAGMGSFVFTPEKGNAYKAFVKFQDGSEKQVDLPGASNDGYVLSVTEPDKNNIVIKIAASSSLGEKGELTVIGQSNGEVQYISRAPVSNTVFIAKLPKKRFPTGILQLTLFSPRYQPVAERLVFIEHQALTLDIKADKPVYGKREKVQLSFNTKDTASKVTQSNFSLAVINESLVPFDDNKETTILSNLLLSSDLKGYVENPNYYFTEENKDRLKHLDYLLLTQGWRRFTWKNVILGSYPNTAFRPEQNINISGRVTNANGNAVAGGKVILLPSKGNAAIMDTITDAEGKFKFDGFSFNDSTAFVLQARNAKDKKNVYIEIDRLPEQMVTKNKNAPSLEINVNQNMLSYLKLRNENFESMKRMGQLRKSIMLAEVKVADKKPVLTNSSNLNGAGNADAIIKADRLQYCQNLAQCLQGMVAGVIVQNGIAYATRSMYSSFSGPVPMQLVVDGMYLEPDYLSMIPPQDVESIEVLKSIGNTAIYGIRGGGGVLIINTKRGERNLSYRSLSPGIATYKPQGLFTAREFYSPVYTNPQDNTELPDLRNTIFWTPNILTDDKGNASVNFYTADAAGSYKVTIEGLGLNGSLVRKVFRFKVQ